MNGRVRDPESVTGDARGQPDGSGSSPEIVTSERVTTVLPAVAPSVGAARRFVAASMRRHHALPETIDVAVLLTSELVTNALIHAGSRVELSVLVGDAGFRIEVGDQSSVDARPREVAFDDLSGRGLHIVDAMSSRWGSGPSGNGKRVWFELDALHLD
jgi:anti-sigma regulatory factor (Ser/Thr protein kinase)